MVSLDEIMKMLDWNNDKKVQQRGLELAGEIKDLAVFLQPMEYGSKAVWGNCAEILTRKTDEELRPYLYGMLEWLQDINWPGALNICARLVQYGDVDSLSTALEQCIGVARSTDDDLWLYGFVDLLENTSLIAKISGECIALLQEYY